MKSDKAPRWLSGVSGALNSAAQPVKSQEHDPLGRGVPPRGWWQAACKGKLLTSGEELRSERRKPPGRHTKVIFRTGNLRINKIEHSMEGCACPMGAITRSFLKEIKINENDWVIADTKAGVEHFGRGVLEGVDAVLMVVDPSYESILLAEKAKRLAEEAHKKFFVILNKVDEATESTLRRELAGRGIEIGGTLSYSPDINRANLAGDPLDINIQRESMDKLVNKIVELCSQA